MAAGVLVQLSSSEESSDEQDSEDDITSSASCSGMSKSTPLSERGDIDSSSSTSAFTSATDTSKRTAPTILTNTFGTQQDHSLQDYIEASLMLEYNYK